MTDKCYTTHIILSLLYLLVHAVFDMLSLILSLCVSRYDPASLLLVMPVWQD